MRTDKYNRMMDNYEGHKGQVTVAAVLDQVPDTLVDRLTGSELGVVMTVINTAYHKGKAAAGAEIIDDCVWVADKLVPLAAIQAIDVTTKTDAVIKSAEGRYPISVLCHEDGSQMDPAEQQSARARNNKGAYYEDRTTVKRYVMDYTERM